MKPHVAGTGILTVEHVTRPQRAALRWFMLVGMFVPRLWHNQSESTRPVGSGVGVLKMSVVNR